MSAFTDVAIAHATELDAYKEVIKAIANAKRFDRTVFADDEAFADWAQNLARHLTRSTDRRE